MTKKYFFFLLFFLSIQTFSQPQPTLSSSEIKLALKKLDVLGSVLYIAAHPDDENTSLIAYLAKGKRLRTGYLSMTRGDGGQNLIGTEQSDQLGVLRTQELLEARKRDGGEQFFTRAVDFGYSKSPEETFEFWDKEKILSDVVWVIRKFKPDVVITRFPPTGQGGHGHHTASAILSLEAFDLANDPKAFPEQLEFVGPWQPKRVFWNAWLPALQNEKIDLSKIPTLNLGEYNTLLGKSYTEISALSRSMHKSQGFGSSGIRNNTLNYFMILKGDTVKSDMFEGIDLSWNKVDGGKEIHSLIQKVINEFDVENPSASLDNLFLIYEKISNLKDEYWKQVKLKEITELIRSCAGIWIEAISDNEFVSIDDTLNVKTSIVNRSNLEFVLNKIDLSYLENSKQNSEQLKNGEIISQNHKIYIPNLPIWTQPYWLQSPSTVGMYFIAEQELRGLPEEKAQLNCDFTISYKNYLLNLSVPVYYRITDPVDGEIYKSPVITPPVTINIEKDILFFDGPKEKELKLTLQSFKNSVSGRLVIECANGWKVEPHEIDFSFDKKNQKKDFYVKVIPSIKQTNSEISAKLVIDNKNISKSLTRIEYKHILPQTIFYDAKSKLQLFNFEKDGVKKIGYIVGSGDKIPDFLTELGFEVTLLDDKNFSSNNLSRFDVIITGIRAYNTRDNLAAFHKELVKYVESGGTLISQYNTTGDLITDPGVLPLKLSRDRVTDENSEVEILNSNHQVFNKPFKITKDDFNGWIQERGLYFPNEWDKNYEALLSMNDKGETPKNGSLLITKYGKGTFVYTGLSFFREIPAGVGGAIKLFINLLYSGK
ncbi:MAG: PIG-L family deacetylase [Ignavibacteriales bacterium]|nr:PIG-L family deacetylase [Ignavibacteriales bacterium]